MVVLERVCQPLHRYTFKAPLIKEWVENHCIEGETILNLFAGMTRLREDLNEIRVDLDIETNPHFCMDALTFVKLENEHSNSAKYGTVILDPPYAYRKSMEKYKGIIASPFRQLKDEIVTLLSIGGRVITFGYHSSGMGAGRGFELTNVLLICHGGAQHDTIAIVEKKVKEVTLERKYDSSELDELMDLL